jgi:hypothetical protein
MSHIFISYSRTDIDFARYLRASLEAEGFPVWMDEKRLSAGMDWWGEIEANIDSCAAFLVIMSPDSKDSVFVQNEILRALDQKKALFPVLLAGKSFGLLAHVQFEDMRGGLNAKFSADFLTNMHKHVGKRAGRHFRFEIVHNLVEFFACDVLVLKYAGRYYGADLHVATIFEQRGQRIDQKLLRAGQPLLFDSNGWISAKKVLFLPTSPANRFSYHDIRSFVEQALNFIALQSPESRHITMTIHGMGFGLDEQEAVMAQLGGIIDRLQSDSISPFLERISIVEFQKDRSERLQRAVSDFFEEVDYASPSEGEDWGYDLHFSKQEKVESPNAGKESVKPFAFVHLPHEQSLEDIFYYGIQRPIHAMGLLCERSTERDESLPIKMDSVLQRIDLAKAFICDVSEKNPDLYLQLGYALGKGIPIALISRKENPDFADAIPYQKIWELEERLGQWLKGHF